MNFQEIPIKQIHIIENHRTNIGKTKINEMMLSIKQHGLQQPIGVSKVGKNKYNLIWGQRRYLAIQKLGWKTITAQVGKNIKEKEMNILCLTENIQRVDPSFEELGRGIEQLKNMDMTLPEISARLGIDLKRIKMILRTYTALPKKHRDKVKFMARGGREKGSLPPQIVNKILRIKRHNGMSEAVCDKLISYVMETDMSKEDLGNLAILLEQGIELDDAIEKLHSFHVYHIDIVADRSEVGRAVANKGLPGSGVLLKRILYGLEKPLKKPSFVKV